MSEEHPPPPGEIDEKLRRTHLINRRSTAWLLEIALVQITVVPIFVALFVLLTGDTDTSMWMIQLLIWVPYLLVRDLLGLCSWGKYVVGLRLVNRKGGDLTLGQRVLRNVPLAIPLFPIVEFFAAFKGTAPEMLRFGDRWAHTQVVAAKPQSIRGQYTGPLVLALALAGAADYGARQLAPTYFKIFAGVPGSAPEIATRTEVSQLGYSVVLPDDVTLTPDAAAGALEANLYHRAGPGKVLTKVLQANRQELSSTTPDQLITAMLATFKTADFAEVTFSKATLQGRPVRDVKGVIPAQRPKIRFRLRNVIAGPRVYQLMVGWPDGQRMPDWLRQAWDTYTLTDKAPKESLREAMEKVKAGAAGGSTPAAAPK